MDKEHIKALAKAAGLKVRESFMDDWPENLAIVAVGLAIGYALGKFF